MIVTGIDWKKMVRCLLSVILASMLLSGCFWGSSQAEKCAEPQLYEKSRSVSLISIPTGLDTPDNQDKLVIPGLPQEADVNAQSPDGEKPCLKLPPNYFDKPVLEDSTSED